MTLQLSEFLCRVCLQQQELLVDIYENVEELQMDLCSLLESCGNIKVERLDEYPKYLCQECTKELLITAKFRKKCAETQIRLQEDATRNALRLEEKECLSNKEYQGEQEVFRPEEEYLTEGIIVCDPIDYAEQVPTEEQEETTAEDAGQESLISASYNCDNCGAVFQQAHTLRKHLKNFHALTTIYDCKNSGQFYTDNAEFKSHSCCTDRSTELVVQSGRHRCIYCGKCLQSATSLAEHLRLHTGERPYCCDVCPQTFTTNGALVTHQKRHFKVIQHHCNYCGQGFVESSNLKRHITAKHTKEKPHTCTVCQRKFSRVYLLELHTRTHTGERPYKCNHCQRTFSQLGVLRSHERIHSNERLHRCQLCPKTFGRAAQLRNHMMRHEEETETGPVKDLRDWFSFFNILKSFGLIIQDNLEALRLPGIVSIYDSQAGFRLKAGQSWKIYEEYQTIGGIICLFVFLEHNWTHTPLPAAPVSLCHGHPLVLLN
ncbi:zinc finger protein 658B isoform X1 [Drosophila pseudoobscura]|uniref:Zinc finger protein 658B isoform X1 n=2 Tax=Drosophila pseudoobscura pseudoobscura TaxID=46245 RepID=A0A6I8VBS6_DROPS|nr:zinc finger protein 658B isoform X1 [Drosophila pseudoobscura]